MSEKLEKRIEELEAEVAAFKKSGPVGLYYELNRLINETVKLSQTYSLRELISKDPKEDKGFERMLALIKAAKEHAIEMGEIKAKLGVNISGDEEKDKVLDVPFIETVAEKRN